MPDTPDIAEVARKLSFPMQRAIRVPARGCYYRELGSRTRTGTILALHRRGLIDENDDLTDFGLAVRNHLLQEQDR